ncbi:diguanylate cyclase domain-containing protein [Aquimonas voraii]|uniref:PAS domain S-box-containing protein/diguanylate cyclase (GGDEF) domain-containing protein n=1 Tax=Aquimonas voraii TaxID=265719 RepID=A0A1G6VFA6_9GAMM|nr:diguanylate cyclase [Aquimonas voraii]SDD52269.1 PAS domain S-box-containing protein/diguanylate cyclase (GGDEF) domain-containing protein [Aquimonas voraii]
MKAFATPAAVPLRWPLALALGTLILSLLSLELSRLEAGVALVWLGNGWAVAVLLWWPGRIRALDWAVLALGLVVARLLADDSLPRLALLSALNFIEVALVVGAVRRFGRPLSEPEGLPRSATWAALSSVVACALVGVLSSLALAAIGERPLDFLTTALTVASAHLLGLVTTASLMSAAIGQRGRLLGPQGQRMQLLLAWLLQVAVLALVLGQNTYPLLFLPLLPLAWLAFRHAVSGAVLGVLSLAVSAGMASILRIGPFQLVEHADLLARSLLPQVYALSACLLALPLALMVAERRRLLGSLSRSEARYRLLADHGRDLVVRLRADGIRSYVSEAARSLLGYAPHELAEPRRELFHPDDDPGIRVLLAPLFVSPGSTTIEFRLRHREGHWVWMEALAQSVPAEQGEGFDVVYSARDISARVAAEQALQAQARTDALTGLANRRAFEERLEHALARARRFQQPLAVFALDLDHFKQINDSLGHAAGDEALIEFGRRIRACVYETDVVARLGGDEFVVLMEHQSSTEGCEAAARRLLAQMAEPMRLAGESRVVGTSIGIAYCGCNAASASDLLATADAALYASKREGRGRFKRVDLAALPQP